MLSLVLGILIGMMIAGLAHLIIRSEIDPTSHSLQGRIRSRRDGWTILLIGAFGAAFSGIAADIEVTAATIVGSAVMIVSTMWWLGDFNHS